MTKLILTDIDETVLHFGPSFAGWCFSRGMQLHGDIMENYDVAALLRCPVEEASRVISAYLLDVGTTSQPAMPCAHDVLPRLYERGFRFVGITACGQDASFASARKALLERRFGFPWEDLLTVPFGACKRNYLSGFEPAVWVEDNLSHAQAGLELGHATFVIDRAYNQGPSKGLYRVKSWYEIEAAL